MQVTIIDLDVAKDVLQFTVPRKRAREIAKLGKSDAIDAATGWDAVTRPTMRFVAMRTPV